ncbi:MAG TPA: EamA family transporter [Saprospirales bacterium]|nr:EamA family transporter [Saprospirales bacterium]|tara:strand:- start:92 stop:1039 length:948 start_codon:yes stop_codon:yes gene_type:complete
MKEERNIVVIVLAFISIYVIWGSTYLLNKICVAELAPFFLASIRFTTAGLLIFLIAKILGLDLSITKKQAINCAYVGILFLTVGNGIVVWALKYVDSGFAALEISAQPLVVLALMRVLEGKKIRPKSIVGLILGTIGIYILVSQKSLLIQENAISGMVMIFACMLSWGYGSLFVAKADLPKNFFINTGYQMFFGGLMLMIASLVFGESWAPISIWSDRVMWSMIILIIFGSIVAFTSFNYLLKIVSPEKVATSTYINPLVALTLGWYILDEQITNQSLVAAGVLLTGVYFINTSKEKKSSDDKSIASVETHSADT